MPSPSRAIHRLCALAAFTLSAVLGCGGGPEADAGGQAPDAYVVRDGGEASDASTDGGHRASDAAADGGEDAGTASGADAGTDGGPPNAPPEGTIDAPAAAHAIFVGEAVVFEASCADPDGLPAGHAWDFGGGAPGSAEEDPGAVTFAAAGSFEVTYTCTDELGLADPTPARVPVEVVEGSRVWVPIAGYLFRSDELAVGLVDVSGVGGPMMRGPFAGSWPAGLRLVSQYEARLSRAGERLAFIANDGITGRNLHVLSLGDPSPSAVSVTTTGRVEGFRWSPDGNKIAYTVSIDDRVELFVADLSGGLGAVTVMRTHDPAGPRTRVGGGFPAQPDWAWSADSSKLYFTGEIGGDGVNEAFMFDLNDPTALAQRLHPPGGGVYGGVHSVYSAGDHIALIVGTMADYRRFDILAVDTRVRPFAPVRLNPIIGTYGVEGVEWRHIRDVLLSPDGSRVLFEAALDDSGPELYVADLSGGVPAAPGTAQSLGTRGGRYAWSPAGGWVTYSATAGHQYVSDLSGPSVTTPHDLSPLPDFPYGAVERSWLPDGSGLVFSARTVDPDIWDLFYVAMPSSGPTAAVRLSRATTERGVRASRFSWLSPTEIVYAASLESSVTDLYLSDVTTPGVSIRLNAPIDPSTGATGCGDEPRRLEGGRRFVAICAWRSAAPEAVLIDADAPGTLVPLHPPPPPGPSSRVGVVEIVMPWFEDWWSGW